MKIFISHASADTAVVVAVTQRLGEHGFATYLAEHDNRAGEDLVPKVLAALDEANAVVALLTPAGHSSTFVHQEIGYAKSRGIVVIPLVHEDVKHNLGVLQGVEHIRLDPERPEDALHNLAQRVVTLGQEQQATLAATQSQEAARRAQAQREEFLALLAVGVVLAAGVYLYYNTTA